MSHRCNLQKGNVAVSRFYPHFDYLLRRSNTVLFKSDCKFWFQNLKYVFVSEISYSLMFFGIMNIFIIQTFKTNEFSRRGHSIKVPTSTII